MKNEEKKKTRLKFKKSKSLMAQNLWAKGFRAKIFG